MPTDLEADYLIVGAGAMGMAFADTLVAETDASVVSSIGTRSPAGTGTSGAAAGPAVAKLQQFLADTPEKETAHG